MSEDSTRWHPKVRGETHLPAIIPQYQYCISKYNVRVSALGETFKNNNVMAKQVEFTVHVTELEHLNKLRKFN